ncbi:MAG: bifunctional phosphopantothenoylcysteine decarboxylase/phosphopantothenate--cysteine ligase CoaBC [Pseudomonadota bacterium]
MPKILLGVCGGIAAYKSAELVRELRRRGCEVRVMMTRAAKEFVTPLTFEALTRAAVHTDLFNDDAHGTSHIETARWADALVVAPLTAKTLSNFAYAHAEDVVSTVFLAFRGPVILAPAMNSTMWEHPAVQEALAVVARRGARIVEPVEGELACGEVGPGKMADPNLIAERVLAALEIRRTLEGKSVLVTAGPTREYLDPVRFLSNPSSGKMGLAVAREAARRGARVTVVHGLLQVGPDFSATFVPVTSAAEMAQEVRRAAPADIFVGTAAVSDCRPVSPSDRKIKKQEKRSTLELEPTEDIIRWVSEHRRPGDLVVGFAAETERAPENAKLKLESKGLDLVVANEVHRESKGFAQDHASVWILGKRGPVAELRNVRKDEVAARLWDEVEKLHADRSKQDRS